jgi:hypothetical protein
MKRDMVIIFSYRFKAEQNDPLENWKREKERYFWTKSFFKKANAFDIDSLLNGKYFI